MGGTNVTKARVTRHGFIIPSRLTAGMARYLFKVEYSSEKFGSFFVNAKEQPHYSFVKLTADIRKNIPSLQYLTPTTIRIRFRDEDGDFVNLPVENNEMFNEMLKSGRPIEDRDYIKIYLKVSELDSPATGDIFSAASQCGNRPVYEARNMQHHAVAQLQPISAEGEEISVSKKKAPHSLCSEFDSVAADCSHSDGKAPLRVGTTNPSPLERYASKLENDVKAQSQKVAYLKDELKDIDDRISSAKSSQLPGNLTVCGNCHLKLGHTARNCTLETCSDVFDCGFEKFHTRQVNRSKLNQEIKKEETALQKLENELRNRRSAVRSFSETMSCQIENRLLRENGPDYYVDNFRNWSLLRRHVYLIETYCKRNFGGKIPPKQSLSYILGLAEADEKSQSALTQAKRRRVHENPAKSVLEIQHGVCFPNTCLPTTSSSAMSCNSDFDIFRSMPRTQEEEEAQLDLALRASSCSTGTEIRHNIDECTSKICSEMRNTSSETVTASRTDNINSVDAGTAEITAETHPDKEPIMEQDKNTDVSDAANVLISLLNS